MQEMRKKLTKKSLKNDLSRAKAQTEENLDNLGTGKVYNFIVQQKFSPADNFKLKNFDRILDICYSEYNEAVEKEIHNDELECTDGVANTFFQVFDLLEKKLKNLEKIWALKAANIIHFLGKFEN